MKQAKVIKGLAGVVLAGGGSRRMGRDKALLETNGHSLLQSARQLLTECGAEQVFACGRRNDCEIHGELAGKGPLAGVTASLDFCLRRKLRTLLIVPVDMPLLRAEDLHVLVNTTQRKAMATHFVSGPLPLCLPINDTEYQSALAQLNEQDLSLKGWLRERNATACEIVHQAHFLNINRPEQWQRFVATTG